MHLHLFYLYILGEMASKSTSSSSGLQAVAMDGHRRKWDTHEWEERARQRMIDEHISKTERESDEPAAKKEAQEETEPPTDEPALSVQVTAYGIGKMAILFICLIVAILQKHTLFARVIPLRILCRLLFCVKWSKAINFIIKYYWKF